MKKNFSLYVVLVSVLGFVPAGADLVMKITADDTQLAVGETTVLRVWGLAQEATGANGLYDWSVSAFVNTPGIVKVNSASVLQPAPLDPSSVIVSKNVGGQGNIDAAAAIQYGAAQSTAGIAYTELFNFVIEGVVQGDVQYGLRNILGDLLDFSVMYDDTRNFNVDFNALGSVGQISVVPEPSTLLLLTGMAAFGALGRKAKK